MADEQQDGEQAQAAPEGAGAHKGFLGAGGDSAGGDPLGGLLGRLGL